MADQYDSSIYIGDSDHNSLVVCAKAGKSIICLKITGLDKVSESNMKWYYDDLEQYNTDEYYSNFNEAE